MKKLILSIFMLLIGLFMGTIQAKTPKQLIVNDPYVEQSNTAAIFVKSAELYPDSTVLRIKSFYKPHNWIKIVQGSTLEAGGKSYKITGANGIELDKEYYLPSSGEGEFSLSFEPLPLKTKVFDFKEGDASGAFMLKGIHTDKRFDLVTPAKAPIAAPRWEKGRATIKGKILNYTTQSDKTKATVYPRCALGRTIDRTYGVAEVNPDGTFEISLDLYQTMQPCFIDIPGLYGLIYLSVGENATVTVDAARRYANGHLGDDGSVTFTGINGDINNQLTSNVGHNMIWSSFDNDHDWDKVYSTAEEYKADVQRFNKNWQWRLAHLNFSDEARQLLSINNDVEYVRTLSSLNSSKERDKAYYDYFDEVNLADPISMLASGYDSAINILGFLYEGTHVGVTLTPEAPFYDFLISSGLLDAEETGLATNLAKYSHERVPADVIASRKKMVLDKVTMLPDTLQLNDDDRDRVTRLKNMLEDPETSFDDCIGLGIELILSAMKYTDFPQILAEDNPDEWSKAATEFAEGNKDKIADFQEKYKDMLEVWRLFDDTQKDIAKMRRITGIDSPDIEALMLMEKLMDMLGNRELLTDIYLIKAKEKLPDLFFDYLKLQNDEMANVLGRAKFNVNELSAGTDVNDILLELVNKFPGKILVIDIWATWCGPCMANISQIEPIKPLYTDDVVFVYLADENSPKDKWEEKIKSISGEHYRLEQSKMNAIMSHFAFDGYPSHIVVGKDGNIVYTGHLHMAEETRELLDKEIAK